MQSTVCNNCGFENRIGVLICEQCGNALIPNSGIGTRDLPKDATAVTGVGDLPMALSEVFPESIGAAISSVGREIFEADWSLRIEVENGAEPVVLSQVREIILGRKDPATGSTPDVDLTPYAGYRMGVSRRHAAIRLTDGHALDLWDLGSSNGTFLNGMRLVAYRPHRLRDGDEIRLGQMSLHAYFQPAQASKPPAPPSAESGTKD